MANQQIRGSFPGFPISGNLLNLTDVVPFSAATGYTTGGFLTVGAPLDSPPLSQVWSLIAWTITLQGLLAGAGANFGRLGSIIAGVARGLQTNTPAPNGIAPPGPWSNKGIQLPPDQSALTTIWDGNTDPAFHLSTSGTPPAKPEPIVATFSPPVPIEVESGETLGIGLWLKPSLIGIPGGAGTGLIQIFNAAYTITLDDGAGAPTPGWGGG